MSGLITVATIATIGLTAAQTVGGIMQGKAQAEAQKKSLQAQKNAQTQATQSALSTQRKGEVAQNAANMKVPDLTSIITRAAQAGKQGLMGTMLTGPSGVPTGDLTLGRSTLLGG